MKGAEERGLSKEALEEKKRRNTRSLDLKLPLQRSLSLHLVRLQSKEDPGQGWGLEGGVETSLGGARELEERTKQWPETQTKPQ